MIFLNNVKGVSIIKIIFVWIAMMLVYVTVIYEQLGGFDNTLKNIIIPIILWYKSILTTLILPSLGKRIYNRYVINKLLKKLDSEIDLSNFRLLFISGPSCSGKAALEKGLGNYGFTPLPIYTDRYLRDDDPEHIRHVDSFRGLHVYITIFNGYRYAVNLDEIKGQQYISVIEGRAIRSIYNHSDNVYYESVVELKLKRDILTILKCLKARGYDDEHIISRLSVPESNSGVKQIEVQYVK